LKKKLLLINPPPNANVGSQLHLENLGLGYIATAVRKDLGKTHNVYIWDCSIVDPLANHIKQLLTTINPDYVGFSLSTMNAQQGMNIASLIKKHAPNTKIILGGILASSLHATELSCFCPDAVIRGEGELLITQVIKIFDESNPSDKIELIEVSQDLPLDVDRLGWASRDMLPWQLRFHPQSSISASRGCRYRCSFCSIPQPNGKRKWRPRNIEDVVEEMVYINNKYSSTHFYFVDDNFLFNTAASFERAEYFAHLLLEKLPDIRFGFMCRSAAIDIHLFKILKKAGLSGVFLGIESFSQPVLDRYKKKETVEEHLLAISILNELGITINPGFIFFDPWTNIPEVNDTLNVMKRINFQSLQSLNSKLTCYIGSDIESCIIEQSDIPSTVGIKKYSLQNKKVQLLFNECCNLFYKILPKISDYITYQQYHYNIGYLLPYFLNTNRERFSLTYFDECQSEWKQGDNIIMQFLQDYANDTLQKSSDINLILENKVKPYWQRGNSIAERFFRFAKISLLNRISQENFSKAQLSSLAFTSPCSDLNIDVIFNNFSSIEENNRIVLAELMACYTGENTASHFETLLTDKADDVVMASINSALRIFYAPIVTIAQHYLERYGDDVSSELKMEIERLPSLFKLSYPEFILSCYRDVPDN
jgi:radical SAM superfamily enzyme YgiQ (UPF0313 family)